MGNGSPVAYEGSTSPAGLAFSPAKRAERMRASAAEAGTQTVCTHFEGVAAKCGSEGGNYTKYSNILYSRLRLYKIWIL